MLDTNVISALMRRGQDAVVERWLDAQPSESVWTTSITVFEIAMGLEQLVTGKRRTELERSFATLLDRDLESRVVTFDLPAAVAAGRVAAERRSLGRPIEIRDAQIAGIAIARKATIATRNVRNLSALGAPVVDPWA